MLKRLVFATIASAIALAIAGACAAMLPAAADDGQPLVIGQHNFGQRATSLQANARSTLVVSNGSGSAIRALSDLGYPVPRDLARPVASIVAVNDDSGPALTVMGGVGFSTADVLTIRAGSRCSESVSPGAIPSARTQVLATLQGPGGSLQFANLHRICLEAPASRNVRVAYFVMQ